jgi:hypothetical protein
MRVTGLVRSRWRGDRVCDSLSGRQGHRGSDHDGSASDVGVVIWVPGCHPDYSWIHIPGPGVRRNGQVAHRRGVTEIPACTTSAVGAAHTRFGIAGLRHRRRSLPSRPHRRPPAHRSALWSALMARVSLARPAEARISASYIEDALACAMAGRPGSRQEWRTTPSENNERWCPRSGHAACHPCCRNQGIS